MDQPQSAQPEDSARIKLTPDMRPVAPDVPLREEPGNKSTHPPAAAPPSGPRRGRRRGPAGAWPLLFGTLGIALGLVAIGAAIWTYGESQREILRLSTELAQLRVSLDLYARNGSGENPDLAALGERLSALEQSARGDTVPMPETPLAAASGDASAAGPTGEDCLPEGMRLLVAAGDTYPICGQPAEVSVSFVDNGYITLGDGTSVASGGTTPLPGSACTIAVTSGGDEGLTGYAEIRVTC